MKMTETEIINIEKIDEMERNITKLTFDSQLTKSQKATIRKIKHQMKALRSYFKERDEIIECMYICLLAKQHLVMIGPPGTGKSYLIESFVSGIVGMNLFQWQVTKFTTPEELFGPYSLPALKAGRYERITQHKLPQADFAYIDEVFNANSSILNALNGIMNEGIFERNSCPLGSLFGATNFIPEESVLVAFFDRFLFRFLVEEIHDASAFGAMLTQGSFVNTPADQIDIAEIDDLRSILNLITVDKVIDKILMIRENLKGEGIVPSSRRFRWAIDSLKVKALLDGRLNVIPDDLFVFENILWTEKKDIPPIKHMLIKLVNPILAELQEIDEMIKEQHHIVQKADPKDSDELAEIMEAGSKLSQCAKDIQKIVQDHPDEPKVKEKSLSIIKEIKQIGILIKTEKLQLTF